MVLQKCESLNLAIFIFAEPYTTIVEDPNFYIFSFFWKELIIRYSDTTKFFLVINFIAYDQIVFEFTDK